MCTALRFFAPLQQVHQEWDTVWRVTCKDFPVTGVYGAAIFAPSQKVHQERAPVWRAKCKDFQTKMKDFRCVQRKCIKSGPQHGEQNVRISSKDEGIQVRTALGIVCAFAESAPRVGPSMESKMKGF